MRNVSPAKLSNLQIKDLTVIILAAGEGRRMKSYGPKSLIQVGDTNLINHQITVLQNKFPNIFDIITVLGFEADRVGRVLPKSIRIVENETYVDTNVSKSISLGLKASKSDNVFLIYGDMYFDENVFTNFSMESCVGVDDFLRIDDSKVGVTLENGRVNQFAYGLPQKWSQIGFFTGKELDLMRKICYDREHDYLCGFEIFNIILGKGGKIKNASIDQSTFITEFNSIKCIENFRKK